MGKVKKLGENRLNATLFTQGSAVKSLFLTF
jgi:hypothetical protein